MNQDSLYLYNQTIKWPGNLVVSCVGSFDSSCESKKVQQYIAATANAIHIYAIDTKEGKLSLQFTSPLFASIRSMSSFKVANTGYDHLALLTDSGNFSLLAIDFEKQRLVPVFNEPLSRSGIRRLSPGEISHDLKGRAVMLTALERNKMCLLLNKNGDEMVISSPLEANRNNVFTIHTVALDTGFDNPVWVCLEIVDGRRCVTFYELDLGLNHIVKAKVYDVPSDSNMLCHVPDTFGVLVCHGNGMTYISKDSTLPVKLPSGDHTEKQYIVCSTVHKMKTTFFILVQNNYGDLFKVSFEDGVVVSYFDTLPVATRIHVLKSGFLISDSEHGDTLFFQFDGLGEDTGSERFEQRSEPQNLSLVEQLGRLNPVFASEIHGDKIVAAVGHSMKVLKRGHASEELISSELPSKPSKIWTCRTSQQDEEDKYLILTFASTTLVLSIGESVEEVENSGIANNQKTIEIKQMGYKSIVQVHQDGFVQIIDSKEVNRWQPPAGVKVVDASMTSTQLCLACSNNELVYFEMDQEDSLVEYNQHEEFEDAITAVAVAQGIWRSDFVCVATSDSTVRVFSLKQRSLLEPISLQALTSPASDLLLLNMPDEYGENLYLHIGLDSGVYIRCMVDTGLTDVRTKYMGPQAVFLRHSSNEVIVLSSKTWISYNSPVMKIVPLANYKLQDASNFHSEDVDGIVGIEDNKLVIFTVDKSTDMQVEEHAVSGARKITRDNLNENILYMGSDTLSVFNMVTGEVMAEHDTSKVLCIASFQVGEENYVVVSTPTMLKTYNVSEDYVLTHIHDTKVVSPVFAMQGFHGKLLVGMGNYVILYELGMKQLLRKHITQLTKFTKIVSLDISDDRIVVGDIRQSVIFCSFQSDEIVPIAQDIVSRHVIVIKFIDYDTVVGGDKFGNIWTLRLGSDADVKFHALQGSLKHLTLMNHFYVDDMPTSFHVVEGKIVYTGLQGTIGILAPFQIKKQMDFFASLQQEMRNLDNIVERDHLAYRSYYAPVKNVIDGDFIDTFATLSEENKESVSLGKTIQEINRRISEWRASI